MSQELQDKKKHLERLEVFLQSPAHKGYKDAVLFDIEATKAGILAVEPITVGDSAEHFKLRGELRLLEQMLTTFEDARVTLKKRIDEIVERTIENATEQKK